MWPDDYHLMPGPRDAYAQESTCRNALRLCVVVPEEGALVLPLYEQYSIKFFALSLVDGHEHATPGITLIGLELACFERSPHKMTPALRSEANIQMTAAWTVLSKAFAQ